MIYQQPELTFTVTQDHDQSKDQEKDVLTKSKKHALNIT